VFPANVGVSCCLMWRGLCTGIQRRGEIYLCGVLPVALYNIITLFKYNSGEGGP
jgi:hypothetical protein